MNSDASTVPASLRRLRALGGPLVISGLNQALSSGTNFVLSLLLVRWLSRAEFGAYGIGISLAILFDSVGGGLLLTQMVVRAPERAAEDRLPFASRVFVLVASLCGALVLLGTGGAVIVTASGAAGSSPFIAATAVTAATLLLKNFFVRHAYSSQNETGALACNASVTVAIVALVAYVAVRGGSLTAASALFVYAGGQFGGALVGLLLSGLPLASLRADALLRDATEFWTHGRWTLVLVGVAWIQTQAYQYGALLGLGAEAVGRANATRLLISPVLILLPSVNQIVMPRLASMRVRDRRDMRRLAVSITAALSTLGLAYSIVLVLAPDWVIVRALGPTYGDTRGLIIAWCGYLAALLLRDGASTLLQAAVDFRALAVAHSTAAVLTVACVAAFTAPFGAAGAVAGLALGEASLAMLLWWRTGRLWRTRVDHGT